MKIQRDIIHEKARGDAVGLLAWSALENATAKARWRKDRREEYNPEIFFASSFATSRLRGRICPDHSNTRGGKR